MHVFQQDEQRRDVVVCRSQATADLVAATLAAYGIPASTMPSSPYPSLDWVEGYRVAVPDAFEARARELLAALEDRDDVAPAGDC